MLASQRKVSSEISTRYLRLQRCKLLVQLQPELRGTARRRGEMCQGRALAYGRMLTMPNRRASTSVTRRCNVVRSTTALLYDRSVGAHHAEITFVSLPATSRLRSRSRSRSGSGSRLGSKSCQIQVQRVRVRSITCGMARLRTDKMRLGLRVGLSRS